MRQFRPYEHGPNHLNDCSVISFRNSILFWSIRCSGFSANAIGSNKFHEFLVLLSIVASEFDYLLILFSFNDIDPLFDSSINDSSVFKEN